MERRNGLPPVHPGEILVRTPEVSTRHGCPERVLRKCVRHILSPISHNRFSQTLRALRTAGRTFARVPAADDLNSIWRGCGLVYEKPALPPLQYLLSDDRTERRYHWFALCPPWPWQTAWVQQAPSGCYEIGFEVSRRRHTTG